jgi:hypothetical protein
VKGEGRGKVERNRVVSPAGMAAGLVGDDDGVGVAPGKP